MRTWRDGDGFRDPPWRWARALYAANSQAVWHRYKPHPEPLPLDEEGFVHGHQPGGGVVGLARVQDRVLWDIEGMLRLIQAIEDAPDPGGWHHGPT